MKRSFLKSFFFFLKGKLKPVIIEEVTQRSCGPNWAKP